jgi:hypothetical protein
MEEALFLTRFASKVYILHRSDNYRASHIMLERARANPKIEFLSNVTVQEVLGVENKEVNGIILRHTKTGESSTLPLSGMFLGIGHEPNTKPFVGQIELDSDGYVVTHEDVHTRVGGVFACGDVQDRRYRQAITAAGSGCAAALEAEKYLEEQGRERLMLTRQPHSIPIWQEDVSYQYSSSNSSIPLCCTFVTLLGAHQRPGAFTMSRTFRSLALSAALLAATTAPAFAMSGPGGTNPPPTGSYMTFMLSLFGF